MKWKQTRFTLRTDRFKEGKTRRTRPGLFFVNGVCLLLPQLAWEFSFFFTPFSPCIYRALLCVYYRKILPCCNGRSCFPKAGGQGQSQSPGFAGRGLLPDFQLPVYYWCDSLSKYFSPIYSAYTTNATHHVLENKDPLRKAFLTSKLYLYITTVQSESLACKIGVFHIYNRYTIIY